MTAQENPCCANAWLGYRMDEKTGELLVRVCAWCDDKAIAETEARRLNCRMTHAICPSCAQAQFAQITGETP